MNSLVSETVQELKKFVCSKGLDSFEEESSIPSIERWISNTKIRGRA
jgi:hypothetical protein